MRDLYLIDGYSLIYRSYFAFIRRPLTNPQGENSSAVFGFFRALFQLIKSRNPELLAIVLDSPVPTFRHELYPEYKANREKAPEDLHAQVPVIEQILSALGIVTLKTDGFEADDILATLATRCRQEKRNCYILSGDKDILQLVGEGTYVITPIKGSDTFEDLDREHVFQSRGIYPEQVVDYLALTGDSADNVPGVPGVGDKTAQKLLALYPNLEAIYADLDSIQPDGLKKKLAAGRESALLSKELVVLRPDAPVDVAPGALSMELNAEKAVPLFAQQGIKSLVEELGGNLDQEMPLETIITGMYETVTDQQSLNQWIELARRNGCFAFDTETNALDEMVAEPLGFSIGIGDRKACYIPIRADGSETLSETVVRKALSELLADPKLLLIGQNIKYDYKVMIRWGVQIRNRLFDTMVAAWVLDSSLSSYGMDNLAEVYLGYQTIHYKDFVGKDQTLADLPIDQVTDYAAEDADITFRLYQDFSPQLKEQGLETLFTNLEMPVLAILADMELTGIRLDPDVLRDFDVELTGGLERIEQEIFEECGHSFNIRSTKELQHVLFTERMLKPIKKTKTGYSTDSQVLAELAREDNVSKQVLAYRQISKLKSTYVETLPVQINAQTGRLHTHFIQTGAATGRLASKDPNLQNIPIREELGRRIRTAFVPDPGYQFLSADYAQIELVILAHLSQDEMLIQAFTEMRDIHRQTAGILFNVSEDAVSPDQRRVGKTINFGIIYGMSAFRLSRDLGLPRKEADSIIERYFQRYAGVDRYIKETVHGAEQDGFVRTLMGRRRRIPHISSRNRTEKMAAERIAMNSPIQGSAADIVKQAMIAIQKALAEKKLESRLLLQVHDELIFEVPESETTKAQSLIKETMERAVKLSVPLRVNIELGSSWGEIH